MANPAEARFELFIGIDYSGAEAASSRLKGLQVYTAEPGKPPVKHASPTPSNNRQPVNWSRKEVAALLIDLAQRGVLYIAGIDHGFSFPQSYFDRYRLSDWPAFLDDFARFWPTDGDHVYVDFVRDGALAQRGGPTPGMRVGDPGELRLCERWTSSAKSVFQFDVQGQVAKSTHAGIPWLRRIRDEVGDKVHMWPFDGWAPSAGKSVIVEVYPSILRKRYATEGRSADEQDAYSVARWFAECAARGILDQYFNPPLTLEERRVAEKEGWIFGIR